MVRSEYNVQCTCTCIGPHEREKNPPLVDQRTGLGCSIPDKEFTIPPGHPSGLFPSERLRPEGSRREGILAANYYFVVYVIGSEKCHVGKNLFSFYL